jgi:hypothetical protein
VFISDQYQATLLELYTSEGCSSCPPADRWLSRLKAHPQLWKSLYPVAFHVDYWDDIGWPDRFADARFSNRQRLYARVGGVRSVYTPGFIMAGREWRSWFRDPTLTLATGAETGTLKLVVDDKWLKANYTGGFDIPALELNIAWLGFAQQTEIEGGENAGKTLTHDFVALRFEQHGSSKAQQQFTWRLTANQPPQAQAIVAWVSRIGHPSPIQTTGGWITDQ